MAFLRLLLITLLLLVAQIVFLSGIPLLKIFLDPLVLWWVFLSIHLSSLRFLWVWGLGIGLLRDLASGGLFGVYGMSFALSGWILASLRNLIEREDPLVQGVLAGILTGLNLFLVFLLSALADPAVGWHRFWWLVLPAAMMVQGMIAYLAFPYFNSKVKIFNFTL